MNKSTLIVPSSLVLSFAVAPLPEAGARDIPKPTPAQLAWQEAEFGVVFHYDLHVFDGTHRTENENRHTAIEDVQICNPTQLDTDQWIASAKAAGATFAIFTASHTTGFRFWQSDVNPYSMRALKWRDGKGDLVRDFVASCRKFGLRPGIYLGARWNSHLGVLSFRVQPNSPMTQEEYNHLLEQEVEEICTRYGPLFELWFDGGILTPEQGGPNVLPIVEKHQPNCLFYHSKQRADARWGGTESGTVPYPCWATVNLKDIRNNANPNRLVKLLKYGQPNGRDWCPAMSDAPLRNHEWFWEPNNEDKIVPLNRLIDMYYRSVGHNSTLILGLMPDPRGLIPDADAARLAELGDAIRTRFAEPVAETKGEGNTITLRLAKPQAINHVIIQEDIADGEHVRAFEIDATVDGDWKRLGVGTCIGQKYIVETQEVTAKAVRLHVTRSVAPPRIKRLAVYHAPYNPMGRALPRVLIIGDSISIGYTPYVQSMLRGKALVVHNPANAQDTAHGLAELDTWLDDGDWDVIHFNWGLWDLCYRHPDSKNQGRRDKVNGTLTRSLEDYETNLRQLVARLKKTNATLIWATITPVPEGEAGRKLGDDLRYNAVATKVMTEQAITIDDLHAYILPKAAEYQMAPGNVHYTPAGYRYLAKRVAAQIEQALSARRVQQDEQASPAPAPAMN
jgi:alpha-L-fucosidase/lysophospholipase L1-like esterase